MNTQRFEFTDTDFEYISNLMLEHAGIHLTINKRELIYGRLAKRLRLLNLDSFAQYCRILKDDSNQELTHCINQLTTNVTAFFRENHHFEYLSTIVLPELIKEKNNQKTNRIRIWSAGCSTGEEPYSIAMTLAENRLLGHQWDTKILASDLDSLVLEKARAGVYKIDQLEKVSAQQRKRWFKKGMKKKQGMVNVVDDLKNVIRFRELNLTSSPWPMSGPFDIIFCRNVVIYFEKEMRKKLIGQFADILVDGGYLFVGHSESLSGVTDRFTAVGKTTHRKNLRYEN